MVPGGHSTLSARGRPASDRQLRFCGSLPLVPLARGRSGLGVARLGYKIDGLINWRYAFNAHAPVLPGLAKIEGFVL